MSETTAPRGREHKSKITTEGDGRPVVWTFYKPEYCEMLIDHMAEGFSFWTFGAKVRVCKKTLLNWMRDHPRFKQAREIGDIIGRYEMEKKALSGLWFEEGKPNLNTNLFKHMMQIRYEDWRIPTAIEMKAQIESDVKKVDTLTHDEVIKLGKEALKFLEGEFHDNEAASVDMIK